MRSLLRLDAGRFCRQGAGEWGGGGGLATIQGLLKPGRMLFVGVTDPINPKVESPHEVSDRVVEASEFIPIDALGTTDDCGFSPFADDTSTSRQTAFAKIQSRVEGTAMAAEILGV